VALTADASIAFLQALYPQGLWALTSIQADRKAIETRTFLASDPESAAKWVEKYNGNRNIYFHVNQPREKINKKADKTDIGTAHFLHVDIDPRAGEKLDDEQVRIRAMVDDWKQAFPAPHIAVWSGGGMQLFWRLDKHVEIGGSLELAEDFERYNKAIELALGGDNCFNVDRIMRLAGTMNLPDEKKVAKGRVPAMAEVIFIREGSVSLGDMPQAPKVQTAGEGWSGAVPKVRISGNVARVADLTELDQWGVPDKVKVLVAQGSLPQDDRSEKQHSFSRSEWVFYAVCDLIRHNVPDEVIFSIITDKGWGISAHVLDQKGDTNKYALKQIEKAREHAVDPLLKQLNDRYAVIKNLGGKCLVVEEVHDEIANRSRLTKMSFRSFMDAWMNRLVEVAKDKKSGEPVFKPAGKWWLEHPMRREFDYLVFAPNSESAGCYNLWQGFAVQPRPGDCSQFLAHMKDNICAGDDGYFQYLLRWMARAVQHPEKNGQSAVVLRGRQGTGKGLFIKTFGGLFGRHFLQVANANHLVGNFNQHLRDCVILFGDEAFYAGDRKHESVLKTLVTEETIHYESKGVDSEQGRNFIHLMMASNNNWVVPADMDDRRMFVLDVSDKHAKDVPYFKAIVDQMESGGREALLHMLMTLDLSGFQVRDVPKTAALHEQKLLSLEPIQEWWYTKLRDGTLLADHDKWETTVMADALIEDYLEYSKDFGVSRRGNQTIVGQFLSHVTPGIFPRRKRLKCEIIMPIEAGFVTKKKVTRVHYIFPELKECRDHWAELFGAENMQWPEIEPVQGEMPEDKVPF
jgi:hypothetical protein